MKRFGVWLLVLFAVVEYYCFVAVQQASKSLPGKWRTGIIIFYILLSIAGILLFLSIRNVADNQYSPNIKALIIATSMGFVIGKVVIAVIMLLGDIYALIAALIPKKTVEVDNEQSAFAISRSKFLGQSALLLGSLVLGTMLWGITNRYKFQVRKTALKIPNLPDGLKGLKILQISDMHIGSFDEIKAVSDGIDLINKQGADMVVFTGDIVNNRTDEMMPYLDVLKKITAPLGVFAILGNHDYGNYYTWDKPEDKIANFDLLKNNFKQIGWQLLLNEHQIIHHNDASFALIGVENWSRLTRFPRYGNLQKAYADIDQNLPFQMLMTHDPSHWDAEVRQSFPKINLTLSGHTHGMQFGVELPWFKWSPVQYLYKQWGGLYTQGLQHLYVNRGFGFLGYQGRVGILPEITVIELA